MDRRRAPNSIGHLMISNWLVQIYKESVMFSPILLSAFKSLASGLLNDALRIVNELSNLAAMWSLQSVSKVQTLEANCIFPL